MTAPLAKCRRREGALVGGVDSIVRSVHPHKYRGAEHFRGIC